MSDFAMNMHTFFEELSTLPPLLTTVMGGLILFLATWMINSAYKRDRKTWRYLKHLWDTSLEGDEDAKQIAKRRILTYVRKILIWFTVFVICLVFMYKWAQNFAEESLTELRSYYKEYIASIDDTKDILRWRTLNSRPGTVCDNGPARDLERSISETICSLEAGGHSNVYQACMAKRGWITNKCAEGSDGCVSIQGVNQCCSGGRFETHPENRSIRCIEMEKEETAISRWERICELNAQIEGKFKARHEMDRLLITSRSYQACMLEQGWHTTMCAAEEDNCNEIEYFESVCVINIRQVLEHGHGIDRPFYCVGREYSPSLDPIKDIPPMN